jgi:hypothetical protein
VAQPRQAWPIADFVAPRSGQLFDWLAKRGKPTSN